MATSKSSDLYHIDFEKASGHWILAAMGKRVLRPGGLGLTRWMLGALRLKERDHVVELAPGVGKTAEIFRVAKPASYIGIERDAGAGARVQSSLAGTGYRVLNRSAEATGLDDESATVVFGEAFLTMQTEQKKREILREANRILQIYGRYGLHELVLVNVDENLKTEIQLELAKAIRVNARPLTEEEWRSLITQAGFRIVTEKTSPMALLEYGRLIDDEGVFGTLRFVISILRYPAARQRIFQMRSVFRKYKEHLAAISIVAEKISHH